MEEVLIKALVTFAIVGGAVWLFVQGVRYPHMAPKIGKRSDDEKEWQEHMRSMADECPKCEGRGIRKNNKPCYHGEPGYDG